MNRRKFIQIAGAAIAARRRAAAARVIAPRRFRRLRAADGAASLRNADFYVTTYGATPRVDPASGGSRFTAWLRFRSNST